MQGCFEVPETYQPRPVHFEGMRILEGWRIKVYSILYGDLVMDWPEFDQAIEVLGKSLPQPPVTRDRPGVGFIIAHRGCGKDYCVLNWWAGVNEFFTRLRTRDQEGNSYWRPGQETESVCVWDLQVIWFERQAYVETVLSTIEGPDVEANLQRHLEISV